MAQIRKKQEQILVWREISSKFKSRTPFFLRTFKKRQVKASINGYCLVRQVFWKHYACVFDNDFRWSIVGQSNVLYFPERRQFIDVIGRKDPVAIRTSNRFQVHVRAQPHRTALLVPRLLFKCHKSVFNLLAAF